MTAKELANSIRRAVNWLYEKDSGCVTIDLDSRLAVCVGWLNGYDDDDELAIHSKSQPSWCINVNIKVPSSDYMKTDYEYINSPYYDNGDVCCDDITIRPNEDYMSLAKYLLDEYKYVKKLTIDNSGLIMSK